MEITLGKIASYLVGIPVVVMSVLAVVQTPLALVPLAGGLLILPPVRRQLDARVGLSFSRGAAAGIGTVSVIVLTVAIVIAASTAAGGGSGPGADVSNVTVSAQDTSPSDAAVGLEATWNARAQSAVDPDPNDLSVYSSNDSEKYIVIRIALTHTDGGDIDLTPRLFHIAVDGVIYDPQTLFGAGNSISDVTLTSESTYSAWLAYSVPEDTSEAELRVNQGAYFDRNVSVDFDYDATMAINMSA